MTKQDQFLLIVQTCVIANAVDLASDRDRAKIYRHEVSASGAFITMDEAIDASEKIPEDKSARDAANEFIAFMLTNERDREEKASGTKLPCPYWFAR